MDLDSTFASDVALLATTSALLHYVVGFYGLLAALAAMGLLENGASLWDELCGQSSLLWAALSPRKPRAAPKTLHRQMTWRFAARDERSRSDAWTEPDDDDDDDEHREPPAHEPARVEETPGAAVTPAELLRQQLLARLSVRGIARAAQPRLAAVNAPVPFETDLFEGHALFLLRTAPEDPEYAHLFAGKRRMFWIQVQGRFKRRPQGVVYLGGELPGRISLGLFTKSIALVIMGIVQSLVGKVYMSFGAKTEAAGDDGTELPAVSFPLYQSVDQFMITPEGETPPPLGRADFGESEQARTRRRQTPLGHGDQVFDVGPTYSFDFHTMYVDLTHWKTANLPGLSDMSLTTFFDSLPLHLVAYEVVAPPSGKHLQQNKEYLFNFEVAYDSRRVPGAICDGRGEQGRSRLWRSDSELSFASSSGSNGTAASSSSFFDSSPTPTVVATAEDQVAIVEALATIDRENASALRATNLELLFWMEELDIQMGVRRVQYVFSLREAVSEDDGGSEKSSNDRVVIVSAYKLRLLLGAKFRGLRRLYTLQSLRFHARSRIDSYSIINDEALEVTACLQRLLQISRHEYDSAFSEDDEALVVGFESALYQILTERTHLQLPHDGAMLSPDLTCAAVGVKLSQRERDEQGIVFESVVYRFYADSVARQEVMTLSANEIQFYRSQSSRPDKMVASQRVIGVQAARVPYTSSDIAAEGGFAFALQINTFAEEIVVCVPTENARNTWIQVILQQCCPHENFDRSLSESLVVCYTPSKALRPANRVVLNSRSLSPRQGSSSPGTNSKQDPLLLVKTALRSALTIHQLGQEADMMAILEFLNHASALRNIDLPALMERPHEERLTFFLNLYHAVLAHAMISHGFPLSKSEWESFQLRMCYVVGTDSHHTKQPLSFSLAEIEHLILRARLPPAIGLPHFKLDMLPELNLSRLARFGIAHPDFRVSFALLMNRCVDESVPIFDAASLHDQLNEIVKNYVAQNLRVDKERKTIFLPRICEWYKADYGGGGSPMYCVRKLLGFMDEHAQQDALEVLDSPTLVHIKYGTFKYAEKTLLHEAVDRNQLQDATSDSVRRDKDE